MSYASLLPYDYCIYLSEQVTRVDNPRLSDAVDVLEEGGQGERQRTRLQHVHGEGIHRLLRRHLQVQISLIKCDPTVLTKDLFCV